MSMNVNKRKQSVRGNGYDRSTERSERPGRPSILANQNIQPKKGNRLQEIHLAASRVERSQGRDAVRRRPVVTSPSQPIGVRLFEEGVVIAAGLSLIVKNGISHIAGWIRDGRELVSGYGQSRSQPWDREMVEEPEEEIWRDDAQTMQGGALRLIGRPAEDDSLPDESESLCDATESPLRQEVERNKVQSLDAEEQGLSEEQLEDQAGALRARLHDASRLG
ncbi:MAG: hypothetical protein HQL98_04605 [Magnetococcales bacterium]|nr:hypothetical protein [Magnetococcales bacterium]